MQSKDELTKAVVRDLEKAVDYTVQKIWVENREIIQQVVYNAYWPTEYERTGEFRNAWGTKVKSSGDTVTGEFKYDQSKLNAYDNHHNSIVGDGECKEYLAEIIYQGLAGAIYHPGYAKYSMAFKSQAWTKKRNAWKVLLQKLGQNTFRRYFEQGLNYCGIKYKRNATPVLIWYGKEDK